MISKLVNILHDVSHLLGLLLFMIFIKNTDDEISSKLLKFANWIQNEKVEIQQVKDVYKQCWTEGGAEKN